MIREMKNNSTVFQKEELRSTPSRKGYSIFSLTNEKDSKKDAMSDSYHPVPFVHKIPAFSSNSNMQSSQLNHSILVSRGFQSFQSNRPQNPQSGSSFPPINSIHSSINKNDNLSEDQSSSSNAENLIQNESISFYENDQYHKNLLNKMRIENNLDLDKYFYQTLNRMNKKELMDLNIFREYSLETKTLFEKGLFNIISAYKSKGLKGYNQKCCYTFEICKLGIANSILDQQVSKLQSEIFKLMSFLNKSNSNESNLNNEPALDINIKSPEAIEMKVMEKSEPLLTIEQIIERKRRHRRNANEIERQFVCSIKECGKAYGSDGALFQHMKNKHNLTPQEHLNTEIFNPQIYLNNINQTN